jgi:hypothetical protein
MATYYDNHPTATTAATSDVLNDKPVSADAPILSEYVKHCLALLSDDAEEVWASKLRRYLSKIQHDVEKDTDVVEWWQVSYETATNILYISSSFRAIESCSAISNSCSDRTGCPSSTGFICSM